MALAKELRKRLSLYLSGTDDLSKFRDWFVLFLRDAHASGEADTVELADAVDWEFVDFGRGLSASEAELKNNLRELLASTSEQELALAVGTNLMHLYLPFPQPKVQGRVQIHDLLIRSLAQGSGVATLSNNQPSCEAFFYETDKLTDARAGLQRATTADEVLLQNS